MALEHKVLVVSVSATQGVPRDPSVAKMRIDSFVNALRRVTKQGVRLPPSQVLTSIPLGSADLRLEQNAIIIFDPQAPPEPCTCDKNRSKYCNCKDKSKCTCPRLKCVTCKPISRTPVLPSYTSYPHSTLL